MTKRSNGFTVIELVFIVVLLGAASILFFVQKNSLEIKSTNDIKKTAINAMYYGLEEVFYPANNFYPESISSDNLKSVDPVLFTDPNGLKINTARSAYVYKPSDCTDSKCKGYTLKSTLANETDFIKTNRNNK